MQFLGFRVLIKRIKAIRFMMADKSVRWTKKAIIIAGLVYLFLPIDIIPPVFFPFGFLDDILIWVLILWYLRSELDKYWIGEKPKDYSRIFRGKNVVDDVEYDVDDGTAKAEEAGSAGSEPEELRSGESETEKEKAGENA